MHEQTQIKGRVEIASSYIISTPQIISTYHTLLSETIAGSGAVAACQWGEQEWDQTQQYVCAAPR